MIRRAATITAAVPSDAVAPVPEASAGEQGPPEEHGGGREQLRRGLTASRVGPRPWRATVPPRRVGSRAAKAYNSFTLN